MHNLLRKSIESIITLNQSEWESIASKSELVKIKRNEFLHRSYSSSKNEIFILKGAFKIYTLKENGTESILYFAFAGDWVLDFESLLLQKPTRFTIKALDDAEIILISKASKIELTTKIPKLGLFQTEMLLKSYLLLQERLQDVLHKNTKERYADFLNKNKDNSKLINSRNLSAYLGVSHEFLSKIKNSV